MSRTDAIAIARRYTTAIFALATEAKQQATVVEEFSALGTAMTDNAELHAALANPLVHRDQKAAVLTALSKGANAITSRAIATIADAGRAEIIPTVAELLRAQLATERGEVIAEITSARPLSDGIQKQLSASLTKATGKTVQLQLKQDPAVLGGVAIQLGSVRLDATLAGALTTMRAELIAQANQSL